MRGNEGELIAFFPAPLDPVRRTVSLVTVQNVLQPVISGIESAVIVKLLIQKYSKNYMEEGMDYIQRAANATTVYRIDIEHKTGKLGR